PAREEVIQYLEEYRSTFHITPEFNKEARSVKKTDNSWITETNNGTITSKHVIVATGPFSQPKIVKFEGMETFPGKNLHSSEYKTAKEFKSQKVLVVGFGNSACEIAIDLYEQGAKPSMSVRSGVNVIPRDLLGIPILKVSLLMSQLPPKLADTINGPLMRILFGDLRKLGLKKMPYGTFQQIKKDGKIPLLDIGTTKHIRKGHIKVFDGIDFISGNAVHFADGRKEDFDAIVAATGYYPNHSSFVDVASNRFDDLKVSAGKQKYFGKDGLYFCGFWIGPTGLIREISSDAQKNCKRHCEATKRVKDFDLFTKNQTTRPEIYQTPAHAQCVQHLPVPLTLSLVFHHEFFCQVPGIGHVLISVLQSAYFFQQQCDQLDQ
ncbi:MAG: NAD(P)/FAD-dependent oxidoreductase, partial [Ginsengibacter sp.]